MKQCSRCKEQKPRSDFNSDKTRDDGLFPYCRKCKAESARNYKKLLSPEKRKAIRKSKSLRDKYDLSVAEYKQLLKLHSNQCAVCGSTSDLCVDHDHETNQVRGILCDKCNKALGFARDDIGILARLINYLTAFNK